MINLTTPAQVKAYAGVNIPTDDALITSMIGAYSQWIRDYTNRDFTLESYDIRRDGRGRSAMRLPQYPVVAVTLVEVDGRPIPAQAAWGSAGYRYDDRSVILDTGDFGCGRANVRVAFTAGYAVVPPSIVQAANELIALRYKLRDKMEWSSKGLAGETITLITRDMPSSVATLLDQYKSIMPL